MIRVLGDSIERGALRLGGNGVLAKRGGFGPGGGGLTLPYQQRAEAMGVSGSSSLSSGSRGADERRTIDERTDAYER